MHCNMNALYREFCVNEVPVQLINASVDFHNLCLISNMAIKGDLWFTSAMLIANMIVPMI